MTEAQPRVPAQAESSDPAQPHDVFVSYSRADREVVVGLVTGLDARGLRAWVDLADIPPSAEWMVEIRAAIQASDGYLVVVTPSLAASKVCAEELELAREAGKRIVPVMVRPTDPRSVPATLAALNWIDATDGALDAAVDRTVEALRTDLDHVRAHTKLGVRAAEWERKDDSKALLLRGAEIVEAEAVVASGSDPRATPAQARYVRASRSAATRRQRSAIGVVAAALVVSLVLGALALVQRNQAIQNEHDANSRALSARALQQLDERMPLALLLAIESYREAPTEDALDTLQIASQRSLWIDRTMWVERGSTGALAASPRGDLVAAAGTAGMLQLWEPTSGEPVGPPLDLGTDAVREVAFDKAGERFATLGTDGVSVWSVASRTRMVGPLTLLDGADASDVVFSPDGELLVVGGEGVVSFFDSGSGDPVREIRVARGKRVSDVSVAVHPDGDMVAAASVFGQLSLIDVSTFRHERIQSPRMSMYALDFSPVGDALAVSGLDQTSAADGDIATFDVKSRRFDRLLEGHDSDTGTVEYSHDGDVLASGSDDGTIRLWNTRTGDAIGEPLIGHEGAVLEVSFEPNDQFLVSGGSDGAVIRWNVGSRIPSYVGAVGFVAFAPDGSTLASTEPYGYGASGELLTGGSAMVVRDSTTFDIVGPPETGIQPYGLAYTPDGSSVLTSTLEGEVLRFDPATGELDRRLFSVPKGYLFYIATSPDGRLIATGSERGLYVIDARTGEEVVHVDDAFEGWVYPVAFTLDGTKVAAGDIEGPTMLIDLRRPDAAPKVLDTGLQQPWAITLSPDGSQLVVAGRTGAVLHDAESGRRIRDLGVLDDVISAAYSADGRTLALGTTKGEVLFLDTTSWRQIGGAVPGQADWVNGVAFDPSGRRLAAGSEDGSILVLSDRAWSSAPGYLMTSMCRVAGRNLTQDEWREYVGFREYRETC